jgi:quercetin dioxygenase-like cupin family protein
MKKINISDASRIDAPNRTVTELISKEVLQADGVTLRLVEFLPASECESREMHVHSDMEEAIYVLAGKGIVETDEGPAAVQAGDAILIPRGERHMLNNTEEQALVLLCFFPRNTLGSTPQTY